MAEPALQEQPTPKQETPEEAIKASRERTEAFDKKAQEIWKNIDWEAENQVNQFKKDTRSWKERFLSFFRTPKLPDESNLEAGIEKAQAAHEQLRKKAEEVLRGDAKEKSPSTAELLEARKKGDAEYAAIRAEYDKVMASGDQAGLQKLEKSLSGRVDVLMAEVAQEGAAEAKLWKKALKTQEQPPMTEAGAELNDVAGRLMKVREQLKEARAGKAPAKKPEAQIVAGSEGEEEIFTAQEKDQLLKGVDALQTNQAEAASSEPAPAAPQATETLSESAARRKEPSTLEEYKQIVLELQHHLAELTDGREGWTGETVREIEETEKALEAASARIAELEPSAEAFPYPTMRLMALEERLAALEQKKVSKKETEAHQKELVELRKAIVRRNMPEGLAKETEVLEGAIQEARKKGNPLGTVGKLEEQLKEIRARQEKVAPAKKPQSEIVEEPVNETSLDEEKKKAPLENVPALVEARQQEKFKEIYPYDPDFYRLGIETLVSQADVGQLQQEEQNVSELTRKTESKTGDALLTDELRKEGITDEEAQAFKEYVLKVNKEKLALLQEALKKAQALAEKSAEGPKTVWDQNVDIYKQLIAETEGQLDAAKQANDNKRVREITAELEKMRANAAHDAAEAAKAKAFKEVDQKLLAAGDAAHAEGRKEALLSLKERLSSHMEPAAALFEDKNALKISSIELAKLLALVMKLTNDERSELALELLQDPEAFNALRKEFAGAVDAKKKLASGSKRKKAA